MPMFIYLDAEKPADEDECSTSSNSTYVLKLSESNCENQSEINSLVATLDCQKKFYFDSCLLITALTESVSDDDPSSLNARKPENPLECYLYQRQRNFII